MIASDNDQELRQKLYSEARADLLKRQLSNSENADRAVLTVSTASLGFSIAFLKDFTTLPAALYINLIYWSWGFFVTAIVLTIISFFTSQKAIEQHLDYARRYYLAGEDDAVNLNSIYNKLTSKLSVFAACFLVTGIIFNVCVNYEGVNAMTNKTRLINDGAIVNRMQQVTETKGATIPSLQALPANPQGGAVVPTMQQLPTTIPKTPDK